MTRTILLADDSVTIQKVVELTFLDEDYRVIAYGNGADAIERLAELRPDLVLADVHMPGADGYEVCSATRERLPGVPVLLLVGTFEVFDAARAGEVGAAGHLKKPFDSQDLLRRVKELLAAAPAAQPVWPAAAAPEAPASHAGSRGGFQAPGLAPTFEAPEGGTWSFEPVGEPDAPEAEAAKPEEVWAGAVAPEFELAPEPPVAEPSPAPTSFAPTLDEAEAVMPLPAEGPGGALSDEDVDRIARRVIELAGERIVRDIAWEVVPDLAEVLLKARIRELEASVE